MTWLLRLRSKIRDQQIRHPSSSYIVSNVFFGLTFVTVCSITRWIRLGQARLGFYSSLIKLSNFLCLYCSFGICMLHTHLAHFTGRFINIVLNTYLKQTRALLYTSYTIDNQYTYLLLGSFTLVFRMGKLHRFLRTL